MAFPDRLRPLLALPPIAAGVVLLVVLASSRPGPARVPPGEAPLPVRVIQVQLHDVVPRALGYGAVEPSRTWRAVAQVSGRIVSRHPGLERGAIVLAGTPLLEIDPREYALAVAELEATASSTRAQLAQLDAREASTQAQLRIEERSLAFAESERARKQELVAKGTISASQADAEERAALQQASAVQALRTTLALVPAERRALVASLGANEARLETARLRLSYTKIVAPFAARVAEVDIDETQFATAGQVLVELHDLRVAEVPAQVAVRAFRDILPAGRPELSIEEVAKGEIFSAFGLTATVRLLGAGAEAEWADARVARVGSALDPETRTLVVIVAVDAPYARARPPARPPLVKGMYCGVELRGPAKTGRLAVPRAAVHDGHVYCVDQERRLRRRTVAIELYVGDLAVLASGLEAGEAVVVSDPVPAIEGMLLAPIRDEDEEARIAVEAAGGSRAR